MKLSTKAIEKITGNARVMNLIAAEMKRSESSVRRWIGDNEANGELTTFKAIQIISKETGLSQKDILIEEK